MAQSKHTASISVPYAYHLSKNATMGMRVRDGRAMYVNRDSRAARTAIEEGLRGTGPWFDGKVWLEIYVAMPTKKSDAINVLDLVADGVKRGIGVDDRWFAARIDWGIDKDNPRVDITVSQEDSQHMRYCNVCAKYLIATPENFYRNKTNPLGLGHTCKPCYKVKHIDTRKKKNV